MRVDTPLRETVSRNHDSRTTESGPQPVPAPRRQWLVQRTGPLWDRGRVFEVGPGLDHGTLGRSLAATWRVADSGISRLHAAVVRRPRRGIVLVDLASPEGTWVNGDRLEGELLLMDGDRIRLGDSLELEYLEGPPPPESEERIWLRRMGWALAGIGGTVLLLLLRLL